MNPSFVVNCYESKSQNGRHGLLKTSTIEAYDECQLVTEH